MKDLKRANQRLAGTVVVIMFMLPCLEWYSGMLTWQTLISHIFPTYISIGAYFMIRDIARDEKPETLDMFTWPVRLWRKFKGQ